MGLKEGVAPGAAHSKGSPTEARNADSVTWLRSEKCERHFLIHFWEEIKLIHSSDKDATSLPDWSNLQKRSQIRKFGFSFQIIRHLQDQVASLMLFKCQLSFKEGDIK